MLKLLKYNWIQSYRTYATIYLIFFLVCLLNPIFSNVRNVREILIMITSILIFAVFVFVTYNTVNLYNDSMFKKSGYLTMTLPVSTYKLVLSKVINAIIWILITCIILFFGISVMIAIAQNINILTILYEVFESIAKYVSTLVSDFNALLLFISFLASFISYIMAFFFITTAVQTKYTRRKKFVFGIIIFLILSTFRYIIETNISSISPGEMSFLNLINSMPLYSAYGEADIMLRQSQITNLTLVNIFLNLCYFSVLYVSTVYVIDNMLEI